MNRAVELFSKALALIYLIAFVSFGAQAAGMIGSQGILPAGNYLESARAAMGARAYWFVPTLFWINSGDTALRLAWILGAALAIVATLGFFRRICFALMLVLYLSICAAGQDFWSFQWDVLLLEAGFLAIFLDAFRGRIWLMRWLLFRLMFMSGLVKLMSGDAAWRSLTAMSYHYETQPLPTPPAWYMFQLPLWFQKMSTLGVFVVELGVPFLIFAPLRLRRTGGAILIALQLLIVVTGNYTFFNLLTIALCIFLFPADEAHVETAWQRHITLTLAVFILTTSGLQFLEMFGMAPAGPVRSYLNAIAPLRIINTYGLFAVMTTTRPEIIMEGSNDGVNWQAYEFRYKPGDVRRAPPWVAPYQPRLDWQMWFAALGSAQQNLWFYNFAARLLQGAPPVLRLLAHNPFPKSPPHYIRATVYDYQFTNFSEKRSSGAWWKRELKAVYLPAVSLKSAHNGS